MVASLLRDCGSDHLEFTPICCGCRRERVGADLWREHTAVVGERVTHGICPACLDDLYPELAPLVRQLT